MRCGNGYSQALTHTEQGDGAGGFRRDTFKRCDLGDLGAHGLHDAPASHHGAQTDGQVTNHGYPFGDMLDALFEGIPGFGFSELSVILEL